MDCAPLNLAHFHERRAERFMRHHRYDEAYKALETSLLYLQDACKIVTIAKSLDILNTLKWDFERKLRQVQMRKTHHERLKNREIIPSPETNSVLLQKQDSQGQTNTTQLIARSIDKAIASFDAKFNKDEDEAASQLTEEGMEQMNKENILQQQEEKAEREATNINEIVLQVKLQQQQQQQEDAILETEQKWRQRAFSLTTQQGAELTRFDDDLEDFPALAPLELPTFDFNAFTTSAPSLAYMLNTEEQLEQRPCN